MGPSSDCWGDSVHGAAPAEQNSTPPSSESSLPSAPLDRYGRGASGTRIAAVEARHSRRWWQKLHTPQSPPGPWYGGCGECLALPWRRHIKLIKHWEGQQRGRTTWSCPSSHRRFLLSPLSLGKQLKEKKSLFIIGCCRWEWMENNESTAH